jgi:hypothetical protein
VNERALQNYPLFAFKIWQSCAHERIPAQQTQAVGKRSGPNQSRLKEADI